MSACARRFESFVTVISSLFQVHGLDVGSHARSYIPSLLSRVLRKNMERFAEEFGGIDYQYLQQFLSDSPWECAPVWKWISDRAGALLEGPGHRMLLNDESSFAKKGDRSAGVARQYCGRLGKTENCQVGVFSALCRDGQALLTGARLYFPKEWTDDAERCGKAGIPKEDRVFATENALAWELIQEAEANGLKFDWVAADSAYGRDPELLLKIAGMGKTFVMDMETTQLVRLEQPETGARKSTHIDAGRSGHGGLVFPGGAKRGGCRSEYKGATSTAETSDGMQDSEAICRSGSYNNVELAAQPGNNLKSALLLTNRPR